MKNKEALLKLDVAKVLKPAVRAVID